MIPDSKSLEDLEHHQNLMTSSLAYYQHFLKIPLTVNPFIKFDLISVILLKVKPTSSGCHITCRQWKALQKRWRAESSTLMGFFYLFILVWSNLLLIVDLACWSSVYWSKPWLIPNLKFQVKWGFHPDTINRPHKKAEFGRLRSWTWLHV